MFLNFEGVSFHKSDESKGGQGKQISNAELKPLYAEFKPTSIGNITIILSIHWASEGKLTFSV
jgi:hypothetical protein